MAISKATFDTAVWSDELLKKFQDSFITQAMQGVPKRTKGAQLLRDAALGHEEFPKFKATDYEKLRHTYTEHAAAALARSIDSDVLDSLRYQFTNIKDVKK